jgi:hypothetical protein
MVALLVEVAGRSGTGRTARSAAAIVPSTVSLTMVSTA